MKKLIAVLTMLGGLFLTPLSAEAHCDTVDGPVAKAALKALETGNVNVVLPYASAEAEDEIKAAFKQVRHVRGKDPEAQRLADRYFLETVVRLHRQGENASFDGLQPAGMDFGPVIPAAENALHTGDSQALINLLTDALQRHIKERLQQTLDIRSSAREPSGHSEVAAAREQVQAELGFVTFAEGLHQAIKGLGPHAEGSHLD